jgi:hypothetical protein
MLESDERITCDLFLKNLIKKLIEELIKLKS